jgi:hypothetical protein
MRVVKVLVAGLAAVGVVTLVRRGLPEVHRYIKIERM